MRKAILHTPIWHWQRKNLNIYRRSPIFPPPLHTLYRRPPKLSRGSLDAGYIWTGVFLSGRVCCYDLEMIYRGVHSPICLYWKEFPKVFKLFSLVSFIWPSSKFPPDIASHKWGTKYSVKRMEENALSRALTEIQMQMLSKSVEPLCFMTSEHLQFEVLPSSAEKVWTHAHFWLQI